MESRVRRLQHAFLVVCVVILMAATLFTLVDWAWWMRLFNHFTFQYVWGGLVLALWARLLNRRYLAIVFLLLAGVHGATIARIALYSNPEPTMATSYSSEIRVLQFNALMFNSKPQEAIDTLVELAPEHDVIVVQEYSNTFSNVDTSALLAAYPHHFIARGSAKQLSGIAVFSKAPIEVEEVKEKNLRSDYLRVAIAQLHIHFIAIHSIVPLEQAWAHNRDLQQAKVMQEVARDNKPSFVIGDFNQTPYDPVFLQSVRRNGLSLADFPQFLLPSWPRLLPSFLLRIPIDHVIANKHVRILDRRLIDIAGSDHMAVSNHLMIHATQ